MSSEISDDSETKNITIRGVDLQIYDEFTSKLRDYNMNIGEAFNKMIDDVLKNFDQVFNNSSNYDFYEQQRRLPRLSIEGHQDLSISAQDLIDTKSRVSFRDIDILKFESSVTKEIFLKHVKEIRRCTNVYFNINFPKLIALAYASDCDNIAFE